MILSSNRKLFDDNIITFSNFITDCFYLIHYNLPALSSLFYKKHYNKIPFIPQAKYFNALKYLCFKVDDIIFYSFLFNHIFHITKICINQIFRNIVFNRLIHRFTKFPDLAIHLITQ